MIRYKEEGKRRRYKTDVTLPDFYKYYKNSVDKPVDYETFKNVVYEFNESICKGCIYDNLYFKMPNRLGVLSIKKRKTVASINKDGSLNTKFLSVNWKATKELWDRDSEAKEKHQKVYHLNRHTSGYILRWCWDRFNINLSNRTYYSLDIMRKYDRELAQVVLSEDSKLDYYERFKKKYKHGRINENF